jgi:pimeloyl-ACP methyl ester carboxylesterase
MRSSCSILVSVCVALALSTTAYAQDEPNAAPRFEWGECPFDASTLDEEDLRCGYLTVPEDRSENGGRMLRLAVAVAGVPGATEDPVVLLPGGPGSPALPRWITRIRRFIPPDRALVVFDPRGTGYSGPVMCLELNETGSAIAALDLTTAEAALVKRGAYLACRDGLLRQGIDLGAYNSTTVALDLKDLREALGYERWNIMSGSYGVPFARAAMRADPDGIRSAVLAIGPGPDLTGLLRRDVPFFARALERVFQGCAAEPPCQEAFPDLEGDFYQTYEALRERPMTLSVDRQEFRSPTFTVNAQDYVRAVYWQLADAGDAAHVPGLVGAFRDRDVDVVRRVVEDAYGGLTSRSSRMGLSVMCYDAHTPASRREWEEAAAPFHPALAEIENFLLPCEDWSGERASVDERSLQTSEVPALIITGEFDPMNPPVTGEEHLRWLPNGHHVAIAGMAHGPSGRSGPCWSALIRAFFEAPRQAPETTCVEELPEVRIVPEVPAWAKD